MTRHQIRFTLAVAAGSLVGEFTLIGCATVDPRPDIDRAGQRVEQAFGTATFWAVGPVIGVELPIFDQDQARIARAEHVHQQAMKMPDALEREWTQDSHVAFDRARATADNPVTAPCGKPTESQS